MLGTYYTFPELLFWIPLVTGVAAIFIKKESSVGAFAFISSLLTLVVSVISLFYADIAAHPEYLPYQQVSYFWMPYIGSAFSVGLDGMGFILTLLTAISFPIVFLSTSKKGRPHANGYYALMLLFQAGLMGVFVAYDALLFYFFWELALIPAYFLCSRWGGPRRIAATFKFFIYTFTGSLLMLIGILYVYQFTTNIGGASPHTFSIAAFYRADIPASSQMWVFWLFFLAFAIKMPIFPLHTWQPDTYAEGNYGTVMILSAVMVKMGVFAFLRWVLPVLPDAASEFDTIIVALSTLGIVYGSCIAIMQDDLKRLVAWASIAHIGLMGAAIFSANALSFQGVMLEMFNHGINILGFWLVVEIIDRTTGYRKISELGGLAKKAPALAIFFLVILLANIALPLTNAFVSEFMMLSGVFEFNKWLAAFACLGVILSAVYMLRMMKNVFYGAEVHLNEGAGKLNAGQFVSLSVVVVVILLLGIYPEVLLSLSDSSVNALLKLMGV